MLEITNLCNYRYKFFFICICAVVHRCRAISLHSMLNNIFCCSLTVSKFFSLEQNHCRITENAPKVGFKPRVKSYASKGSTLMKPTVSYLAKKTQRYEATSLIRCVIYWPLSYTICYILSDHKLKR
jgi:hypothetical protein